MNLLIANGLMAHANASLTAETAAEALSALAGNTEDLDNTPTATNASASA